MKFVNHTPFEPLSFQSLDLEDEPFQVIVLKGTFDIIPDSKLVVAEKQQPVCLKDEHYGEPGLSSLRQEDDIAPFKLASDIVVNATAHAPGARAAREWLVGIKVGRLQKRLLVTGPRYWKHDPMDGWQLSEPEPAIEMPIRYEHAFGGLRGEGARGEAFEHNPVGRGFVLAEQCDTAAPIPAPTIVTPGERSLSLNQSYKVEGLSAICKCWQPRRGLCGTYDESWIAERHPKMPLDFDYRYYSCAHPDLIYDGYLIGNEEVRLEGLARNHEILSFSLPDYTVAAAITDNDDFRYGGVARLDMLFLDVELMKAMLTWRLALPRFQHGIRRIEAVMCRSFHPKAPTMAAAPVTNV